MSFVLRPRSHSLPPGFAQLIAQRFGRGPFLVVGTQLDEFAAISAQNGKGAPTGLAIWFYPGDSAGDDRAVAMPSAVAESVLVVPEPGDDSARRRPELVRRFAEKGFLQIG